MAAPALCPNCGSESARRVGEGFWCDRCGLRVRTIARRTFLGWLRDYSFIAPWISAAAIVGERAERAFRPPTVTRLFHTTDALLAVRGSANATIQPPTAFAQGIVTPPAAWFDEKPLPGLPAAARRLLAWRRTRPTTGAAAGLCWNRLRLPNARERCVA